MITASVANLSSLLKPINASGDKQKVITALSVGRKNDNNVAEAYAQLGARNNISGFSTHSKPSAISNKQSARERVRTGGFQRIGSMTLAKPPLAK